MCWCNPSIKTPNCDSPECVGIAAQKAAMLVNFGRFGMDKDKLHLMLEEASKDIKNGCDIGEVFNDLESNLSTLIYFGS